MWIVKLALSRPYTFVVLGLLILLLGGVTVFRMSTDIFPVIDIPVVAVVWQYNGVAADEMEKRIVTIHERAMTTTVNDIEHIESQSLNGLAVIKVFFQPNARPEVGVAQVSAISQTILRVLPPGITPPLIIQYSASNVPVLQASVSSDTLSESDLFDFSTNFIRTQLAVVQGASTLLPNGGKPRQIMVDINPDQLYAHGLSATDVSNAINAQNLILPAGTAKMGEREYNVRLNSSPEAVEALNNLPIREVNGAMIYIRDVAQVRDGFAVQQNIVRSDGKRSAVIPILKSGSASTLDVVNRIKEALPRIQAGLPESLKVRQLFDQSVFVRAAINGVLLEAAIAACLTALMILIFLGSWRSTLIVTISIPLSILCSIIVLDQLGQTLNVMTLGGLALAVGILVDDATVEIENIHRNLAMGKPLKRAILDGAQQVATPAFVATLSICVVFVPVAFIAGAARSLFLPLALAVVFAMLASYLLSRTLIPTLVVYLLKNEVDLYREHGGESHATTKDGVGGEAEARNQRPAVVKPAADRRAEEVASEKSKRDPANNPIWRFHQKFNVYFDRFRDAYSRRLSWALDHRLIVLGIFLMVVACSAALFPFIGSNFFPAVDAGQIRLHVRAPAGTRVEETERVFADVEAHIRRTIPPEQLELILDNIGLPTIGINLVFGDNATISAADGEILVALKEGKHDSTEGYVKKLRAELPKQFPNCEFFFQPADIVTQILNFGIPAPIDIQVTGPPRNQQANLEIARQIEARVRGVHGAADVHLHQVTDVPELFVNVDRTRAEQVGLSQRDVAQSLLISLSSSGQTAPNFWLNPQNGVSYQVAVQTPQYRLDSIDTLQRTPLVAAGAAGQSQGPPQLLSNVGAVERRSTTAIVSHYNVQPTFNVYANTQERDLGGVAGDINKILEEFRPKLARGSQIVVRGQVQSMTESFYGLGFGLTFAIVLVYFLMVVNFQSWLDPLIILMAIPGALCGILWMLFVTQTTISVPALMGSIMCVGVATANSILLITFANELREEGKNAREAALEAGHTRLRPVLMTALAMIIGMMPMALGLGEGGEQNAPLGRAVIGGLFAATFATLFFVPVVYTRLRAARQATGRNEDDELDDEEDSARRMTETSTGPRRSAA